MSKKYEFSVVIEKDEDGVFIASVPTLKGCHTYAKTLPKVLERIKEAILLCLDVQKEVPQLKFIGLQEIEVEV